MFSGPRPFDLNLCLSSAHDVKRTPLGDFTYHIDDPWHPLNLVQPGAAPNHHQHTQSVSAYSTASYHFSDYRSASLPSECDTLPGDSAYGGSRPTFSSVESAPSVFGDERCADTDTVDQLIGDLNVNPDRAPYNNRPLPPPLPLQRHVDDVPASKYRCDECKLPVKTKSELKKHSQRHNKPYKCTYPNCPRGMEGFSTPNDLTRHKRTVHREHSEYGPVYICRHDPCATKKHKPWPRADNFRSHLARTHSINLKADDDLGYYLYRQAAERPHDLQGVGSSVAEIDPDSRPMQLQDSPGLRGDLSSQMMQQHPVSGEDDSQFIRPDVFSGLEVDRVSGHALAHVNSHQDEAASLQTDGDAFAEVDVAMEDTLSDEDCTGETRSETFTASGWWATSQAEPSSEPSGSEMDTLSNSTSECQQPSRESHDSSPIDSLSAAMAEIRPDDPRLLELLRLVPKDVLQTVLNSEGAETDQGDAPPRDDSNAKATHACPDCSKRFFRQCELTKHKKRHEKPYGCTFRFCTKSFGSKNDWKRHESSQHFQLETWNCDLPGCHKVCHRRETFKNHLYKDHQLENHLSVDDKLERCRLGRHCDPRFWCGFCVRIIEIKETGVNSWTKRCDHIDNHLFGKEGLERKPMSEWRYLEVEVAKVESERASEGNIRKRKGEKEVDPRKRKRSGPSGRDRTCMWRCCMCSQYMNYKTYNCCIDCHHHRCKENCLVERVADQEQEVEAARQEMDGL